MAWADLARLTVIVFFAICGCGKGALKVGGAPTVSDASYGSGGFGGTGGDTEIGGSVAADGAVTSGGADGKGGVGGTRGTDGGVGVGGAVTPGMGGDAGAGGAVTSGGAGGKGGVGGAPGTGGVAGSGGTSGCASIKCHADFPCSRMPNMPVSCIAGRPDSMSGSRDVSCEEACGTPCCDGEACERVANRCPSGHLCAYPDAMETTTDFVAKCVPEEQTCGGPNNQPCPDGQYCELFGILCSQPPSMSCPSSASPCSYAEQGGVGICRMKRPDSQCGPGASPVCGCDGVTYPSECARIAANVVLAHTGSCSRDGGAEIRDAGGRE